MGTLYSDIYIDGENSEVFAIEGAQIKEAWLNGECIWKLGSKLTISEVYQIVRHDGGYYVLFSAGEKLSETVNSSGGVSTTWRSFNYYIGCGNEIGFITDVEVIKNAAYRNNPEYFIAQECDGGLFVYLASVYAVGTEYMYFKDYDIHAEVNLLEENPLGRTTTLNSLSGGWYLNGVITDKYLFYFTGDDNSNINIRVTDLKHNHIKYIEPPVDGLIDTTITTKYSITAKGNNLYLNYYYKLENCRMQYTILDTELLEYRKVDFVYDSLMESMLDDLLSYNAELGYIYEKPSISEISSTGVVRNVIPLPNAEYLGAEIKFNGRFALNGKTRSALTGYFIINMTSQTYTMGIRPSFLFDLGNGYTFMKGDSNGVSGEYLMYNMNIVHRFTYQSQSIIFFSDNIRSFYENGFFCRYHWDVNVGYIHLLTEYTKNEVTVSEVPEIEILEED